MGIIEKPFSSFSWEDLATVGINVLAVPKHRIQYFKFRDEIVWDKRSQMDNFFGSRGGRVIQDIVAAEKQLQGNDTSRKDDTTKRAEDESKEIQGELIELEVDQDALEGVSSADHVNTDRNRPTHFVCFRITNDQVKKNVSKIQSHITSQIPQLAEGCLPVTALHVTLCMVRLENDHQISVAQEVMKNACVRFIHVLPRCSELHFTGVSNFHERLVYMKVAPCPALDNFVFFLIESFQEAGLRTPGNHKEYTAHMTLMKLSRPMQRELPSGVISPALYQPFVDVSVGSNRIEKLSLCSMTAPRAADGFYVRLYEISNSLSGLSSQFISLLNKRLEFFCVSGVVTENELEKLSRAVQAASSNDTDVQEFDVAIEDIIRLGRDETMCSSTEESMQSPVIIIFRGVPGSGKSFLATHCSEYLNNSATVAVCTADSFFTKSGDYKYSAKLLPKAHAHCLEHFLRALDEGKKLVIVDNTNSKKWEYEIYSYISAILGHKFHILEVPCPNERILEAFRYRNQHNVESTAASKILQRWEVDERASLIPPSLAYPRMIPNSPPEYSLVSLCAPKGADETLCHFTALTVVYTAVFLTPHSQWKLVSTIVPSHLTIRADHITLAFEPGKKSCLAANIGSRVTVRVTGSVDNGQIQVATVELPHTVVCKNSHPHVTVSAEENVSFKLANDMLQRQRSKPLHQTLELEGIIGVTVRERNELDDVADSKEATQASEVAISKRKQDLSSQPTFVVKSDTEFHSHVLPKLTDSSKSDELEPDASTHICTGKQKITKIYVFDFDGTLFSSPDPKEARRLYENYTGKKWERSGWLVWPESLLPPVKTSPGPALPTYRDHISQAGSLTVVLTGRIERVKTGLLHVLENFKVYPEQLIMKPDANNESTPAFKARIVQQLLKRYRDVTLVKFWDDNPKNLAALHSLSMASAHRRIRFEIIDAPKMLLTVATKQGKKMKIESLLSPEKSHLEPCCSAIESYLVSCGYLPSKAYKIAAKFGIRFIAEQFCKLLGYSGDPLNLAYVFGSFPLGRRGDVDLCLLCPSHFRPTDCLEQLWKQLGECGINYLHKGYSSRCPRLKVMLEFPSCPSIDYDIVFASISDSTFFDTSVKLLAPEVSSLINPEDQISKTAITGAVLLHKLFAAIDGAVSKSTFCAVVEIIVQILTSQWQKGNAYHCIRTFHIVRLLTDFIRANKESFKMTNPDRLFKEFVNYTAGILDEEWEKLFDEVVPSEYIPRVRGVLDFAARETSLSEEAPTLACYKELLNRSAPYPPAGYTMVEISLSGRNTVALWKLHAIIEARLPSYIRQLISLGLDVLPNGNTDDKRKFAFAVLHTKSAKQKLQRVLRPFWSEIAEFREEDGLNVTLCFGQTPSDENEKLGPSGPLPAGIDVTKFLSDPKRNEMHISQQLTSYERMLVYETCEQLGLSHTTVASGKEKHIVIQKK